MRVEFLRLKPLQKVLCSNWRKKQPALYIYLLNLNKCLFVFACLKLTNCTHKDNGYYRGIIWELWLGDYSLREARMLVRPAP